MLMQDNAKVTFRKGELAVLDSNGSPRNDMTVPCWRRTNKHEDDAWDQYVRQFPLDDAGEPRIRSSNPHTTDYLEDGTPVIIIKARCTATIGWQHYGKLVQVIVPSSGNTYYVQRKYVAKAVSCENSVRQ